MFLLIAWTLLVGFLGLLTFVCAIVCLCLKDKKRAVAIDALLVLATLTSGISMMGSLFPSDLISKSKSAETTQIDYRHQADLCNVALKKAIYYERANAFLKPIARMDFYGPIRETRKGCALQIKDLLKQHPGDGDLIARIALLIGADGQDAHKFLQENPSTKQNDLVDLLNKATAVPPEEFDKQKVPAVIENKLPEGWFRYEATKVLMGKTSDQAQKAEKSLDEAFEYWQRYYATFQAIRLAICLFGIFVIIKFCQSTPKVSREAPTNYGFRKAYGCLLANFCAQVTVVFCISFTIGIYIGVRTALEHQAPKVASFASVFSAAGALASLVATLLSLHFFICRPAQKSMLKGFWLNGEKPDWNSILRTALLGFCAMVITNVGAQLLCLLLPAGKGGDMTQQQVADAMMSGSLIWMLAWAIFFCIIAPLSEEVIYRGLLYPWLRARWGVACGMIISALVFAAMHFQPHYLPQHIVMGLVFAAVYERYRSLPMVTIMHSLWNLWVLLTILITVRT